jgi:LysR family glycine cleavage system transcriptional activator
MQHRISLNQLNAFAVAAEHLSFQAAAEELYVTASAVSHQIRSLEDILGYKLFDRLDKRVRLTAAGERLFLDIRMPIKQIHEAGRKALRGVDDNKLALSVAPVFATGWLLPRLKDFYSCYPDISLSLVATSDYADFNKDPFDASIRLGNGEWEGMNSIHLIGKEMVAVSSPSLLKQTKGMLTPAEVVKFPLVLNASMPNIWKEWILAAGAELPPREQFMLQVESSAQAVEVVQSGESIGLVDRHFFQQDIASGRLAIVCEHVLRGDDGFYLLYPEATRHLPSFHHFKDWLCESLKHKGSE